VDLAARLGLDTAVLEPAVLDAVLEVVALAFVVLDGVVLDEVRDAAVLDPVAEEVRAPEVAFDARAPAAAGFTVDSPREGRGIAFRVGLDAIVESVVLSAEAPCYKCRSSVLQNAEAP
jgi:hypothetical protein